MTPKTFHSWALTFEPVLPGKEVAVAYLSECGFSMFEPHDKGVVAHGATEEVDVDQAEACLEEIRAFADLTCVKTLAKQENWNAQWESSYPLVEVFSADGEMACTIRAPFHDAPAKGMDVVVAPQMSFGTGHHATTHLMTEAVLEERCEGAKVLDMGCGAGVLALVAAIRGAHQVHGIDIEADAVQNAKDNVLLNPTIAHLGADRLHFETGDGRLLDEMESGHWDVVLANIHKNVLTGDMPRYAKLMKPGGRLYLSGFFEGDAPAMKRAAESSGLVVLKLAKREGWACMHCGKPS